MSVKPQTSARIHVAIGHERSLCGLNPRHGDYDIRTTTDYFLSEAVNQYLSCLHQLELRGYSIERERNKSLANRLIARGYSLDGLDADNPYTRWQSAHA